MMISMLFAIATADAVAATPAQDLHALLVEAQGKSDVRISDAKGGAEGKIVSVGADVFCAELRINSSPVLDQPTTQVRCYPFAAIRWIGQPAAAVHNKDSAVIRVAEF